MNTPATEDEYHTMDELYAYRMAYHAHSAQGWMLAGVPVVKSWKHSDGEPCFGGGWFIVSAQLATGQVTNHYKAEHWDLFNVPAVDLPPAYDGHTPADALDRILRSIDYSAKPPATEDEREALIDLIERARWGAAVAFGRTEVARIPASSRSVADAILAAGFRLRPTPSVDERALTLLASEFWDKRHSLDSGAGGIGVPQLREFATAVIALLGSEG